MVFGTSKSSLVHAEVLQGVSVEEGTYIPVHTALDALLYSGVGFQAGDFLQGSALVRVMGVQQMTVGPFQLTAASGLFHMTYLNEKLTVAAITTPVVLQLQEKSIVVPVGQQWQSSQFSTVSIAEVQQWFAAHSATALPQRFLKRQLQNGATLPKVQITTLLPSATLHSNWRTACCAFLQVRLPKKRQEVQRQQKKVKESALLDAVEAGDLQTVQTLLDAGIQPEFVALLLESFEQDSAMAIPLLEYIVQDQTRWLLYAVHPRWRDATWTIAYTDASTEVLAIRLVSLFQSDELQTAVTPFTMQRWQQAALEFSNSIANPVPFMEEVFTSLQKEMKKTHTAGFPKRAKQWLAVALETAQAMPVRLSDEAMQRLQHVQSIGAIDTSEPITLAEAEELEVEDIVSVPEEVTEPEYAPDAVENRTISVLQSMGAIFTVETTIKAIAPNTAQVQGILFSVPSGDYTFDFFYNVAAGKLENIVRNTQQYPYALDVESFTKWVQE